jgi:Na+/H+ antiporter NhaC
MISKEYASIMMVGSTMRSITDPLLISREKLAFLVDSTASPISSLTIWVAYAMPYISDYVNEHNSKNDGTPRLSALDIYLKTLASQIYPLLVLLFVAVTIATGRDFGPMRRAERRALKEGKLHTDDAIVPDLDLTTDKVLKEIPSPHLARWWNSILPLLACGVFVVASLLYAGHEEKSRCLDTAHSKAFYSSAHNGAIPTEKEELKHIHLLEHMDVGKYVI